MIDQNKLYETGKDENWLKSKIKQNHQVEIKDILLATVDRSGSVQIFLYK